MNVFGGVCGGIALAGVAVITVVCLSVQFLRTDLDWITTSMSMYAIGTFGTWVQAGFLAMVPGFAALGLGWHGALRPYGRAQSDAALALFVTAAIALCLLAVFTSDATPAPTTLHGAIHQWAAFATFVCATSAMMLQSWLLRCAPRWHKEFRSAFAIALIAIVYFWIYALIKPIPRGVGEKVIIGLVLLWAWRSAWWLLRAHLYPPARTPGPQLPAGHR